MGMDLIEVMDCLVGRGRSWIQDVHIVWEILMSFVFAFSFNILDCCVSECNDEVALCLQFGFECHKHHFECDVMADVSYAELNMFYL